MKLWINFLFRCRTGVACFLITRWTDTVGTACCNVITRASAALRKEHLRNFGQESSSYLPLFSWLFDATEIILFLRETSFYQIFSHGDTMFLSRGLRVTGFLREMWSEFLWEETRAALMDGKCSLELFRLFRFWIILLDEVVSFLAIWNLCVLTLGLLGNQSDFFKCLYKNSNSASNEISIGL